jgi:hypothetical protein
MGLKRSGGWSMDSLLDIQRTRDKTYRFGGLFKAHSEKTTEEIRRFSA